MLLWIVSNRMHTGPNSIFHIRLGMQKHHMNCSDVLLSCTLGFEDFWLADRLTHPSPISKYKPYYLYVYVQIIFYISCQGSSQNKPGALDKKAYYAHCCFNSFRVKYLRKLDVYESTEYQQTTKYCVFIFNGCGHVSELSDYSIVELMRVEV